MKLILSVFFIINSVFCFAQKEDAYVYKFKATTSLDFDSLILMSTPITFVGEILSIVKDKYQLVISNVEQPETNFNITTSNTTDTILYDLVFKKVYIFSENKGMLFTSPVYSPGSANKYNKGLAEIIFSENVPFNASPFPVIVKPKKGLQSYQNKNSTFTYTGKRNINIDLEKLIMRAKSFPFVEKYMNNPY